MKTWHWVALAAGLIALYYFASRHAEIKPETGARDPDEIDPNGWGSDGSSAYGGDW